MLSVNDISTSDSFYMAIWLYQYSGKTHVLGGNVYLWKTGNAEKLAETVCVFSLT